MILIQRRGYFVSHNYGCISIYYLLSYPLEFYTLQKFTWFLLFFCMNTLHFVIWMKWNLHRNMWFYKTIGNYIFKIAHPLYNLDQSVRSSVYSSRFTKKEVFSYGSDFPNEDSFNLTMWNDWPFITLMK